MAYNNDLNLAKKNGNICFLNTAKKISSNLEIKNSLKNLNESFAVVNDSEGVCFVNQKDAAILVEKTENEVLGFIPSFKPEDFGNEDFKKDYGLKYAYMGGSMANEISSAEMVIAFGKAGMIASFGAGGLSPQKVEECILKIKQGLPNGPYCFNLIHSPQEPNIEKKVVELYLQHGINVIEASAFINLTPNLVHYRLAGLSKDGNGKVVIKNKVIAKISRDKIAQRFMSPAPKKIVDKLLEQNLITPEQAELSQLVPMADDITAEGDSGGHTDNRPMITLFSVIRNLRDEMQEKFNYEKPMRVGLGGGVSTPESLLAAFMMGADYVVTGSINQACVEAGTSIEVKNLLAEATMTDIEMAPAADMFEMGVKVQVLKKGTMYPMRAQKLYDAYIKYDSIDEISVDEKEKIETQILQKTMEQVWQETVDFFTTKRNDTELIEKANNDPKKKMALIFRWYLGLSPFWGRKALPERKMDYQIWCGPSMGGFNDWTKGTDLEKPENRFVADVAVKIMSEAASLLRLNYLKGFGVSVNMKF